MDNYHLTHNGDQWRLSRENAERATIAFGGASKEEALHQSAAYLKDHNAAASLKVHLMNGQFQEERTYPRSADPSQSPG